MCAALIVNFYSSPVSRRCSSPVVLGHRAQVCGMSLSDHMLRLPTTYILQFGYCE